MGAPGLGPQVVGTTPGRRTSGQAGNEAVGSRVSSSDWGKCEMFGQPPSRASGRPGCTHGVGRTVQTASGASSHSMWTGISRDQADHQEGSEREDQVCAPPPVHRRPRNSEGDHAHVPNARCRERGKAGATSRPRRPPGTREPRPRAELTVAAGTPRGHLSHADSWPAGACWGPRCAQLSSSCGGAPHGSDSWSQGTGSGAGLQ